MKFLCNVCIKLISNQMNFLGCARKTRIIDVVYNASNNELVRTKTLVKNAILVVDATPFRQWYESHYILPLGRKKGAKLVSSLLVTQFKC
jgi:ribosomal protein S8E